jgi:hypothetical protein
MNDKEMELARLKEEARMCETMTPDERDIFESGLKSGYEAGKADGTPQGTLDGYDAGYIAGQAKWVKIETGDDLPDYYTLPSDEGDDPRLLITTAKGKVVEAYYGQTFYSVRDEGHVYKNVTAWMPLPAPYTPEEK